ncbi:hypothetical protein Dda_5692 [Drechslerella dactyloides]|uniref:BZIP domain-containing protein n=1 Tax=Drechslerella dactyloides TaxID=74499 RepID=A0AAD6IX00_DREDA|nr:hypothetical protein Dda_5692 [Drechslerella dactyloides]
MSDITIAGDTQPQPKRRRITEKRRAQNREAQRLFRERKRKKIFESLSHSVEEGDLSDQTGQISGPPEAGSSNQDVTATLAAADFTTAASSYAMDETIVSNVYNNVGPMAPLEHASRLDELNDMARRLYDADYANRRRNSSRQLISLHWLLNDPNDSISPDPMPKNPGTTTASFSSSSNSVAQGSLLPFENDSHLGRSEVLSNVTTIYEVPVSDSLPVVSEIAYPHEPSVRTWGLSDQELASNSICSSAMLNTGELDPLRSQESLYSALVATGHSMRDIIKAGLEALAAKNQQLDFRISGREQAPDPNREDWEAQVIAATERHYLQELLFTPPPPIRSTIIIEQISLAKAILINAEVIGLHNPWPEDFKDNFKSPFVQSYFLHEQSLEAVKNKFAHLEASLRPSEAQCTTPHKVIIDVLPFRGIKDKMMRAITEGWNLSEFNELEFCEDMGRKALVCWGSGRGEYGGQPWNPKSWEARPWFLKKWANIVDDELKESSRWWRRLRDEEVEDLE